MRRPKWLSGWGKGKNPFEGSLIIDIPEIKVVEASFNRKLVFFAIGTPKNHRITISDEQSAKGVEAKYDAILEWKIFYDPTGLPNSTPVDKAKDLIAGTVAVISGSASVYGSGTIYIASGNRPSKGSAPALLDYELAEKIDKAKKKTRQT